MYGWDMLDYYKLVAKRNWVFSFLKVPLATKLKVGFININSKGGIICR